LKAIAVSEPLRRLRKESPGGGIYYGSGKIYDDEISETARTFKTLPRSEISEAVLVINISP